jgi:hypothetical protein
MALTREDVKALREATTVVFGYSVESTYDGDGVASKRTDIRAIKRLDAQSCVWSSDLTRNILAAGSMITAFDRDLGPAESVRSACTSISVAQHDEAWRTVVGLLRVGDEIVLRWYLGNDTPAMREAGIALDELHLIVQRANSDKRLVFRIEHRASPTHSSARMATRVRKAAQA